jgi:hypothetical protein
MNTTKTIKTKEDPEPYYFVILGKPLQECPDELYPLFSLSQESGS